MAAASGGAAARAATQPRHAPLIPTQYRVRGQGYFGWLFGGGALLFAGSVATWGGERLWGPVMVLAGGVMVVLGVWSARRLVARLRRLDAAGITRWTANVAAMLLPVVDARHPHGLVSTTESGVQDAGDLLPTLLEDRDREPTAAPWAPADRDTAPPTGSSGPTRTYWAAPAGSLFGLLVTAGVILMPSPGYPDPMPTLRWGLVAASALPTVIAFFAVLRYRVTVHADGRLVIRRLLGRRELPLHRLTQVSGWTWSVDTRQPVGGRPRLCAWSLTLAFADGTHVHWSPMHVRDDELIARALRWWVERSGARVTPDMAYGLGLVDDPRDRPRRVPIAADDPAARRVGRRLRTAAAYTTAATCVFHPMLGIPAFFVLA